MPILRSWSRWSTRIPAATTKPGSTAVQDRLQERLRGLGFTVERRHAGAVWRRSDRAAPGQRGRRGSCSSATPTPSFPRGRRRERPMSLGEDRIFGPGTCDMKAGILTGIYAVEALDHDGLGRLRRDHLRHRQRRGDQRASFGRAAEGRGTTARRHLHAGGGARERRHRHRAQGGLLADGRGARQGGARRRRAGEGAQRDAGASPTSSSTPSR